MREAAPAALLRALGRAFHHIGQSDIEKMKTQGLSRLNIRRRGFLNSFKFGATDSRQVRAIGQLSLSEYTGAKPFRIFQAGGDIQARNRTLTIFAAAGRSASGKRKYSALQLRYMLDQGTAKIVPLRRGPAIVRVSKDRKAPLEIIAFLRSRVQEQQRIDFFRNYESNAAQHDLQLEAAAEEALAQTLAQKNAA